MQCIVSSGEVYLTTVHDTLQTLHHVPDLHIRSTHMSVCEIVQLQTAAALGTAYC